MLAHRFTYACVEESVTINVMKIVPSFRLARLEFKQPA